MDFQKIKKIFYLAVYAVLLLTALYILLIGPIKDLIKHETIFTESMVKITELETPIEWPSLTICKMPRDKNNTKFGQFIGKAMNQGFASQDEYDSLSEQVFHTDVRDIVYAVTIADSYLKAVGRAKEVKIEPPYVTPNHIDFFYMGHCAVISFQALRKYLIEKGELESDSMDSSFVAMIFLKVKL